MAYPFFISYFLLNAIVVLDLSVGVFINALSDAKKLEKSVFNRTIINRFIELWGDYDPDSTQWIYVDQLIFLLFELPMPFGQGGIAPKYGKICEFEKHYHKRREENKLILKALYNQNSIKARKDEIKWIKYCKDYYLLNEYKGIIIKETRAPMILKNHHIPVFSDEKVHFRDVFQQIIKNAFDNTGGQYEPGQKTIAIFQKKWRKPIKRTDILLQMADEFVAGKMLCKKILDRLKDKK